ncbi:MAG: hypothetical protein R2694_15335 [Ilumatobacteraceae bacterium]
MTSHTIIPLPRHHHHHRFRCGRRRAGPGEQELGRACDDPDEFEAALFHYGLAA